MKTTIWEIERDFHDIMRELYDNEGVFNDSIEERLAINKDDFEEKARSYQIVINQYTQQIENRKFEISKINLLNDADEEIIDNLKERLKNAIKLYGSSKITPTGKLNYSFVGNKYPIKISSNMSEKCIIDKDFNNPNYISNYTFDGKIPLGKVNKIVKLLSENEITINVKTNYDNARIKEDLLNKKEIDGAEILVNYGLIIK
jgi:hypothetical protein